METKIIKDVKDTEVKEYNPRQSTKTRNDSKDEDSSDK